MVNTNLLKDVIRRKGYTMESLSKDVGISRTSLFNKMHNKNEFLISEINTIGRCLGLSKSQFHQIFFA